MSSHAAGRHKGRWGARSPTREDSHDELSTSAAHKGSPSADSRVSRDPQPSATSHQVRLPVLACCRTICVVRAQQPCTASRSDHLGCPHVHAALQCARQGSQLRVASGQVSRYKARAAASAALVVHGPLTSLIMPAEFAMPCCHLQADLVVAMLRKHLGMTPGLALVCIWSKAAQSVCT